MRIGNTVLLTSCVLMAIYVLLTAVLAEATQRDIVGAYSPIHSGGMVNREYFSGRLLSNQEAARRMGAAILALSLPLLGLVAFCAPKRPIGRGAALLVGPGALIAASLHGLGAFQPVVPPLPLMFAVLLVPAALMDMACVSKWVAQSGQSISEAPTDG